MYGVAVAMVSDGFKSVAEIINEHLNVGNKFYFSTSYRFDKKKLAQVQLILFYSKSEDLYYLGKIDRIDSYGLEKKIPDESAKYSPVVYAEVPERNWFLVSDVQKKKLSDLYNLYYNNITVEDQIRKSKRSNMFYFSD